MATSTRICRPKLPLGIDLQYAFCDVTKLRIAGLPMVRSQTDENVFSHIQGIVEKGLGTYLLPQVVLISLIKPISNSIFFKAIFNNEIVLIC